MQPQILACIVSQSTVVMLSSARIYLLNRSFPKPTCEYVTFRKVKAEVANDWQAIRSVRANDSGLEWVAENDSVNPDAKVPGASCNRQSAVVSETAPRLQCPSQRLLHISWASAASERRLGMTRVSRVRVAAADFAWQQQLLLTTKATPMTMTTMTVTACPVGLKWHTNDDTVERLTPKMVLPQRRRIKQTVNSVKYASISCTAITRITRDDAPFDVKCWTDQKTAASK